ncbi:MAG: hypothetical protein ACLUFV_10970 [Acutalibacteraceae bacterium]
MACALCFVVRLKTVGAPMRSEACAAWQHKSFEGKWNKDAFLSPPGCAAARSPVVERKAVFMIKVCLENNRQLYFYVQNIRERVQRRAAPLLVWRRKISLRMVCAALRRKPSGDNAVKTDRQNENDLLYIRYNEI